MKLLYRAARKFRGLMNHDIYRKLYEAHVAFHPEQESVGNGPYDAIGRIELDLLKQEGLAPEQTLLDLGCGNGRLAVHAIPYLQGGQYIGTDVSSRMLAQAQQRIADLGGSGTCRVTWLVQRFTELAVPSNSVDRMCAFSVFTHIEHEDTYLYLLEARRVVRPGGKFIFSCLPLDLAAAKHEFLEQAKLEFGKRWASVRNVVTSRELMTELATMAGWKVERWYVGNEENIVNADGTQAALGQSSCVLLAP